MKRYFAILLLLTTIHFPSHAQSLLIGTRLEFSSLLSNGNGLSYNASSGTGMGALFTLGYRFNDIYSIETHLGASIAGSFSGEPNRGGTTEFSGTDIGFTLRRNIVNGRLYLLGGLNVHDNEGESGGASKIYRKLFFMPGIGLGVNLSKSFSVELKYYRPIPSKIGEYHNTWDKPVPTEFPSFTIDHVIKLNVGYNFSIPLTKAQAEKEADPEEKAAERRAPQLVFPDRDMFFKIGAGLPDLISAQLGYQVSKFFSIAAKTNFNISEGERNSLMVGLRLTGYMPYHTINNISVEYEDYFFHLPENLFSNASKAQLAFTVGHENLYNKFFNFYWAAGVLLPQFEGHLLIAPTGKLGFNINLF